MKARWREIVGERLAAQTEPVKLVKGRNGAAGALEIRVDGPAAALIQHQAPQILDRVKLFLGEGAADRLRIVQGPLRRRVEDGRTGGARPNRRGRPALDAAAEAKLLADLAGAPDGPLKSALLRLGREVLRRNNAP